MSKTDQTIQLSVSERFLLLLLMDHHIAMPREQVKLFKLIERLEFTEAERKRINLRYDEGMKSEVFDTRQDFDTEYSFAEPETKMIRKIYNDSSLQVRPTKTIRSIVEKFNLMEDQEDAAQKAWFHV